jgi:hypothetical protein
LLRSIRRSPNNWPTSLARLTASDAAIERVNQMLPSTVTKATTCFCEGRKPHAFNNEQS